MNRAGIIKIGILLVFAIIVFIWGISYLRGKDIFNKDNYYYIVYEEIGGLTPSSSVMINGYKIGQVTDIKLHQDTSEYLVVRIMINSKFKVRKGAVAQIYSTDLMGTKAIRILYGKGKNYYNDGDTLPGAVEGDLMEQVNMEILPLKKKAESLIGSIDSAIVMFRAVFNEKTQENLRRTFASLKNTVANLENSTKVIDTLMSSESTRIVHILSNVDSISSALKNNKDEISNIIENFSAISDSLAKADIAHTLMQVDTALLQFNEILAAVNKGDGTISQLLHNDTLYMNIENATYHLNRLLRDMHENPKRYVNFSLMDFGKTVYVEDKPDDIKGDNKKSEKKKKEN
jgi:phospholipid/cholesterol/gamma-HCH transport system substrate-binding protein